jgi:serine/threonine protein kinase
MEKLKEIHKREEQIFLTNDKYHGKAIIRITHKNKETVFSKIYCYPHDQFAFKEIIIHERLAQINTNKIIKYYGSEKLNDAYILNFEYCPKGSMYDSFKEYDFSNNLPLLKKLILQIVSGLKLLHKKGVIHNDIKAENILVFENNKIKICDFGNSLLFDGEEIIDLFQDSDDYILTPSCYRSFEWDYVCLGVMIYELYFKKSFGHFGNSLILRKKIQSKSFLTCFNSTPIIFKDFLVSLITNKLNDRNILTHRFLKTKGTKKLKATRLKNDKNQV